MTHRELNALPVELSSRLKHLDRKVRGLAVIRGLGFVCVVLCAGMGVGLLTDWLFDLPSGLRVGILLGVAGIAMLATARSLIRPLLRHNSAAELAALVDSAFPELRERLESTVELTNPNLPDDHKGSPLMRAQLLKETVRKSAHVDFGAAADSTSAVRWISVAVLALLLIVLPFGLSKDGYALMLSRFLTPWRNLETATNLYFEVDPGDRTVARGDDVTLKAMPKWRLAAADLPDYVWLSWENVSGETDERRMDWSATDEAYLATLPHVFTSFDYRVSAGRARTRSYHIHVVERPDITEFALEITPPAYTGRASQSLDGAIGRTDVFEGSQLTFQLAFNKPIESAEFVWLDADGAVRRPAVEPDADAEGHATDAEADPAVDANHTPIDLSDDGLSGRISFNANRSGAYAVVLHDADDLRNLPTAARELVIVPDQAPRVGWTDLDPSQIVNIPPLEARPGDQLQLPVTASDDLAVSELSLHLEVIQRSEELTPLSAESLQLGQALVGYDFDLKLGDFELREGDLLSVRARAVDSRVPQAQEGWSPARLLRISKDADPASLQALLQEQRKLRDALDEIRAQVQADRETARELETAAAQSQKDKQPLDRQPDLTALQQNERDARQKLEQLAAVFESHPLQHHIADATRQVADEPLEKAQQHVAQAESAAIAEQRDHLRKAIGELSTADKQLEQLIKQFDELAALERDLQQLQQLAEQAERLATDVELFERDWSELERAAQAESLPEPQQQAQEAALAERQRDLQDDQEDLTSALDHLLEERPEILEAARQQQLKQLTELADQAEQLAQHQERLAEAMRREPESAKPPAAETPAVASADSKTDPKASTPTDTPAQPDAAKADAAGTDPAMKDDAKSDEPGSSRMDPGKADAAAAKSDTAKGDAADPAQPQPDEPSPVERQQQLADDAARQALETAKQQGIDSPAAQKAREFAQQARASAEEAERGLMEDAAKTAQQASQAAAQTSEQMTQADDPPSTRMMQQAEALSQQQADVAAELQEASQSAAQRQSAQQQGQQQLAQETSRLSEQLAQAAERLNSTPLNQEEAGQRAAQAGESTQQAQAAQEQAQSRMQEAGQREAADPAREAAEALKQAAQQARQAGRPQGEPQESPVPGPVGEQVTDARRQLEQAGQQLQQAGPAGSQPPPGTPPNSLPGQVEPAEPGQPGQQPGEGEGTQPGEAGQPMPDGPPGQPTDGEQPGDGQGKPGEGQGKPGEGQPGEAGKPGDKPSDQPAEGAGSESMRQVAQSLQNAAQQMGLQKSQQSKNNGQDQQSGDSQQGADGPQGGNGARGVLSLAELEAELGRISNRNWGQLPDRVESELQQAQRKKPDGDYARLIRLYFEDVSRRRSATEELAPVNPPEAD